MAPENPLKCHLPGVCPAAACHSAGRKEEAESLPALSPASLKGPVLLAQTQAVTQGVTGRTYPAACRVGRFCLGYKP